MVKLVFRVYIFYFCGYFFINTPGVAGALWGINQLSHPLWKYLQNTFTPKPLELGSWHFERRFTLTPQLSSQPLCGTEPGPNSRQALSHQLTKEGCRMSEISPRRRQCLIITLWMIHGVPVIDHGPKIQWVAFLMFSLFQNPAAMSLKVKEHFGSLTNMWKIDFLWIWTV